MNDKKTRVPQCGEEFTHFKGGRYIIVGSGLRRSAIDFSAEPQAEIIGLAVDAEAQKQFAVVRYSARSLVLIGPGGDKSLFGLQHVIYESMKDKKWWFRTVENFNSDVETEADGGGSREVIDRFRQVTWVKS